jgi:CO dehydrogenase/acetyl-CoA synthase beta subunit
MSANLKEEMGPELQEICAEIGEPDLLDKIADGNQAGTVEELVEYLEKVGHPAITAEALF